jgi:aspartyl-tRNA(Asn)/glutamyl-tRNA(Gln) amidotransferase subunit C
MQLTREVIEQVALLARLRLGPEELQRLTGDVAQITSFVEQLDELATDHVEPLAHAMELCNVFADDRPQASLRREAALANAPKHDGEYFLVPAVL